MKNVYLLGLSLLLSMSVACAAETEPNNGSTSSELHQGDGWLRPVPNPNACTPLRGPGGSGPGFGMANPASVYCAELGYVAEGETCGFPDGTSCEQWAFFRGECGQVNSFCSRHGGQLSVEEAQGTTPALCTLPSGASCDDKDFATTCQCE